MFCQDNGFGKSGEEAIANALANNKSITSFYGPLYSTEDTIEAICERNKSKEKQKKAINIMIVGDAGVGKSNLLRSLNNLPFEGKPSSSSAVDISTFHFLQEEYQVRVTEFGDLEIFNFIHPLFQNAGSLVIFVANEAKHSSASIDGQIRHLKNFHQEILLVLTCFIPAKENEHGSISHSDCVGQKLQFLEIENDNIVRISNKNQTGIEDVKKKLAGMVEKNTVGWTLDANCVKLFDYFNESKMKQPIFQRYKFFKTRQELEILEKSGLVRTASTAGWEAHIITNENLLAKMFQGLRSTSKREPKEKWEITGLENGVISEADFKKLYHSLLHTEWFGIENEEIVNETWEVLLDFLARKGVAHRIAKKKVESIEPCVIFPSQLPHFHSPSDTTNEETTKRQLFHNINERQTSADARNLVRILKVSATVDRQKVMDFIFPRLMIKLWDEIIDVDLCWADKFVVRGDQGIEYLSLELENAQNVLTVTREGNDIVLESLGNCFGIIGMLQEELEALMDLFVLRFDIKRPLELSSEVRCCESKMTACMISSDDQLSDIEAKLEAKETCTRCERQYSGIERIGNVWDVLRVLYVLRHFPAKAEFIQHVLDTAGEFVRFPINQLVTKAQLNKFIVQNTKKGAIQLSNLQLHKLLGSGAEGSVYRCCAVPEGKSDSSVLVSKYFACKITNCHLEPQNTISSRALHLLLLFLNKCLEGRAKTTAEQRISIAIRDMVTNKKLNTANAKQTLVNLQAEFNGSTIFCEVEKITISIVFGFIQRMEQDNNEFEVLSKLLSLLKSSEYEQSEFPRLIADSVGELNLQTTMKEKIAALRSEIGKIREKAGPGDVHFNSAINLWMNNLSRIESILLTLQKKLKNLELYLPTMSLDISACLEQEIACIEDCYNIGNQMIAEIHKDKNFLSHANAELRILEALESKAREDNRMHWCSTLTSFKDQLSSHQLPIDDDKERFENVPVVVDLMNIFTDGSLEFFTQEPLPNPYFIEAGESITERLVYFLQLCMGVEQLKAVNVVHKDIKLANTLFNKKLGWACICDFGIAIQCNKEMTIDDNTKNFICGGRNIPPEIKEKKLGSKLDKADVFLLASVFDDLLCKPISCEANQTFIKNNPMRYGDNFYVYLNKLFPVFKDKMEHAEYEQRLSIEEVVGITEYFLILVESVLYKTSEWSSPLRQLGSVEYAASNLFNQTLAGNASDLEKQKIQAIMRKSNKVFSVKEKIKIELLLKIDERYVAETCKLIETHFQRMPIYFAMKMPNKKSRDFKYYQDY